MTIASYLRVVTSTSVNIVGYAATSGRYLYLEGRVSGGVFRNWIRGFRYRPREFHRPTSEREVVDLVRAAKCLRVFGSGHSFNDGVVSEDVLVSLDDFSGLVSCDRGRRQITVRAGTRVKDVVKLLAREGLAFAALPSHDAQSIGGILSTDVHGTGRDWGFVSESVVSLTLVDGRGEVQHCQPDDELFRAAVGGVGAVGIITEVTVQGVPRFNVEQRVTMSTVGEVTADLDRLLAAHEHLSLYLYPFSDRCQVNTWNSTEQPQSPLADLREFMHIAADAWLAATLGNALAYGRLLPLSRMWSRVTFLIQRGSDLVLESNKAFNRSLYHQHQELEFTVAQEDGLATAKRFVQLYQDLYSAGLPYTLVEVRFTPAGHQQTMIGAGRERKSAWIDLITNDSDGYQLYYAAAVQLVKEIGGRPHLGKFCAGLTAADLEKVHGDSFRAFCAQVVAHDPGGKFANAFTRRLFGTPSRSTADAAA